ncbi:DUF1510 family protein [Bacillus sp. REN3]|uniref:DUF1510 family protein n=1 Tax=Bacillus sp. REN3 TaxID=2802440 RepID=UPI001AEE9BD1
MGKKIVLFVLTAVTVFILGTVSFAFQFITSTRASVYEEIDESEKFESRKENIDLKAGDPISILLMGIDSPPGEVSGRADTMVLVTVNPDSNSMHMVSIPRDTYMNIAGGLNKINTSYQVGGAEKAVQSVENLLDVPVDYFVTLNMNGFEGIVDAYDGVEVNNDLEFTDKHVHFTKGRIHLDGKEALIYARMRKKDPRGDFGRQKRQRQVIEAIMKKGESVASITKLSDIANVVKDHVKTNMTLIEMWEIQSYYKGARENIHEHKIAGFDKTINGIYYFQADRQKLEEISNELKMHLGLKHKEPRQLPPEKRHEQEKPDDRKDRSPAGNIPENPPEKKPEATGKEQVPKRVDDKPEAPDTSKEKIVHTDQGPESEKPNVEKVITKNWPPVPTRQENHKQVTFDKGSLDWKEMTEAIAKGAGLSENDMILWWVAGDSTNSVIATVTNKAQAENYRVYVSWIEGVGYKPTKVEVLRENDKKQ